MNVQARGMRSTLIVLALLSAAAQAAPPDPLFEQRYCGPPTRLKDGSIRRRADVIATFQKIHPCPSTGKTTGACPNWAKDHPVPLACGGCDAVWNMQWLPVDAKAGSDPHDKDRWERKVYAATPAIADTAACKLELVP
jgi:hypothetical protein